MNQQSKMLTAPIDKTVRSLRKIAPLALAALVVTIALLITYIPNVPAMAQAERGAIPSLALASNDPDNRYVCPTLTERGPDDCTTPPIDAEYLDRLVVTRMVENVLTNKNLQTVIHIAQEQSGKIALQHRAELETINSSRGRFCPATARVDGSRGD